MILTIDFDIIMAPDIDLYNQYVTIRTKNIEDLSRENELLKLVRADYETYEKLTKYIIKLKQKIGKDKFKFIEDHGCIYDYLKTGHPVDVVNIDHHHDLGYTSTPGKTPRKEEPLTSSWAYVGLKNNAIADYKWIRNINSDYDAIYENSLKVRYKIDDSLLIKEFNLKNLETPELVVLCKSTPWVPKQFRPLFNVWEMIIKEDFI